jgi:hypothetical protein
MNTDTLIANPMIALDCPACDATILVEQLDLDGEIRCDGCQVAFEIAGRRDRIVEALAA